MKKFNPMALIRKYKFLIFGIAVISGIFAFAFFSQKQSYTAAALIEYTNAKAEEGLAPDGTEIDTSEIYSKEVLKEVFERMGLSYDDYNVDEFRSKVVVSPVMTSEEEAIQEAVNEKGEEVETKPTRYMVSLTLSHKDALEPDVFARQLLDNMLDVFLEKYGENHVNSGVFVNRISEINMSDYEYLEIIETIETSIKSTYETLSGYIEGDVDYVSSVNGYSFQDLYHEFSSLLDNEIPDAFAYILNNTVAKDKNVLLSKYQNRIETYQINNKSSQEKIDDIKEIIDSYVKMMRESGNTDITYEYILDQIYDDYYADGSTTDESGQAVTNWVSGDETVEYDTLLENYVTNRGSYENSLIEIAYCQYIIDLYNGTSKSKENKTEDEERILSDVDVTVTYRDTDATQGEKQQTVEDMLSNIAEKSNTLYDRLIALSNEYNQYAGAQNIGLKSDIIVNANIQTLLYSLIVIVTMAIIASLGVIVAGRTGDIINYYLYMDKKLLLLNRAACDRYLKKNEKLMLRNAFVCISIVLKEVKDKNKKFGREECDKMMTNFAEYLKEIFPSGENNLIAVNGLGQFIVFLDGTTEEQARAYLSYLENVINKYNESAKCKMEYSYGVAETEAEDIFQIRRLMICAINKSEKIFSEIIVENSDDTVKKTKTLGNEFYEEKKNDNKAHNKKDEKILELLERLENLKRH